MAMSKKQINNLSMSAALNVLKKEKVAIKLTESDSVIKARARKILRTQK